MTAVDATLPLSTAQTDVWFDEQLSGGGLAYAMADYLDIRGRLDIEVFKAAARGVADEAECFRARFFEVAGEPRQVIEPLTELPVQYPDMSGEADPVAAAIAWMHADMGNPFGVTDFPLFRGALIKVGPERHFWYLTTHHLVGDGYSAAICHRRLGELYNGMLTGEDVSAGKLPPFEILLNADLAYHDSPHRLRDKAFWGRHFDSTPDLVSLSGKEPAPARGFLRRSMVLPDDTAVAVRAAAARAKVTLPTFFIAAMAAYTQRISGINDLLLTVPVAARAGVKSRATPGMVANYLPLRMVMGPAMTLDELLAQASKELAATLKHQRYHVNQIRRDIGVRSDERRPFGGPFVNVLPPDPGLRLGECETRLNNLSTGITNDLSLTVLDTADGGIEMHLNGNPDLYTGDGVDTHLQRLAGYVHRLADAPEGVVLGRVDVVSDGESDGLLALGIGGTGDVDIDVVTRVREMATRSPAAVAVVDDGRAVTYTGLVGMASALSRRLPSGGVVGVLAGPGVGFVSSVLGILGAGGAYVPLDPGMPVSRLAGLLVDSGACAVIVAEEYRDLADDLVTAAGVPVDVVPWDDQEDPADQWAPVRGGDLDLAYVIFTSGSTGRPKGAMVHRRGMVNHLLAKIEDLDLQASDVVVQNAPLTFDVSVWQMLAPLLVGAQVHAVSRAGAADPDLLFGLIGNSGVTVLEVVPSLLRAALDSWDTSGVDLSLQGLRWLVVTGEALPPDLCVRWLNRFPLIPLVNAYGPTECSDDVTHAVVRAGDDLSGVRVPIGKAVRNSRLYVLGDELRPVPIGAMGELYVGGLVVGRGYVGDAGRTASVFVADPFGTPGTRMYRTGDRVVSRPDGSLEFVERRDFQVKIRGHRIELGEIESVLRSLPGTQDAVVRVLTDISGTKRLAGYLVAVEGGEPLDPGVVRSSAQQLLPDYMVPSAILVLDAMPLTEHGKVDRNALPEPDFSAEVVGRAPRNAVEAILCDVLAEVLSVPRVYIDDNFFALGGDSISAIQVVSRARKAGLSITPRHILESRTPAAIAEHATLSEQDTEDTAPVVPAGPLVTLPADELAELSTGHGPVEDVLPLSPLQQGLLFHTEFDPDGVDVYTVQATANLAGDLDVTAMRQACAALMRRHATLRAYFRHRRTGVPVQLIAADVDLPWHELDLSHLTGDALDAELARFTDADRARRFDLAHPPLVRFTLIKLAPQRYRFLWTAHHIATDGWSVPILIRELATLYTDGVSAALPEVTPFRHYLAWVARQDEQEARTAWREVLDGLAEPTRIAPAPCPQRALPEAVELRLSTEDTARLTAWAREHELTLNTIVQACWAMLVGRLTGHRDVVFGAVTSGRPADLPGVETMVGMFVNTVPVRAQLDPYRTVRDLLTELGGQQSRMLSYQHVGLAEVMNDVPGLSGMGELFDTAVVFENVPADDQGTEVILGDSVRVLDAVTADSRHYPLSLVVEPGRELVFRFDYAPEIFDATAVRRVSDRFTHLLDTVLADVDTVLGRVDVVSTTEIDGLLGLGTGSVGGVRMDVVTRVREVAAESPNAVAVADDIVQVTYSGLVGMASALSRRLPAGAVVGVLAGPGVGFVSSVLGILGAGGAYVPLDAGLPVSRLAGLLVDSGAAAMVVAAEHRELAGAVVAASGAPLEIIDWDGAVDPVNDLVPVRGDELDLAYVIFTSGSTGRPKGAMVHRRGMVNHLLAKIEDLGLRPSDMLVQNAPLTFDVSVWQMLAPLLVGARVRAVGRESAADPDVLFGLIDGEGVTVLEVVPSLLRAALDAWDMSDADVSLPGLRWLVVTGEALPPDLCVRWFARFPEIPLVNAYGPTECSDDVTHAFVRADDDLSGVRVPIGKPVRNSRLYVLGDELRPVPVGVMGELYVGGLVVGRGYVGDAGRTASVFVADPYGVPGTRMYRTGDRVVSRPDGSLEFVERRDFQVKIRGHRIELGEIEARLAEHPAVGESVVLVRGDGGNDRHLVAYVAATEPVEPGAVREYLREHLPAYMVPAAVVVMDKFPLTPHGKIDRNALPAPERAARAETRGPRTPVEATLCAIYAEVLGVDEVGIDDDFFTLGGHSLLATALVSRVRSTLDVELPLRELFEARTVARLAGRLASAGQARATFRKLDRPDQLPLSFAQTRMWFLNRLEGGGYNIPLAARLFGAVDKQALAAALSDVVTRHEILRTVFPDQEGMPYQRVLDVDQGGYLTWTTVSEEKLTATLSDAATRGFDLATEVPLRASLFSVAGTAEHVLLLVVHHIAGDAWSVDVLVRDLATAYEARLRGQAPAFAELPAQYADYAIWQRELLGGADDPDSVVNRQLDFWRGALAGVPDELALPSDLPRGAAGTYTGGSVEFDVPADVHSRLVTMARERGASLFMVVQAAVAALLTKLGAGTDIPLGSLVAGRTDEVANDLIGFFVNTLVLRADTSRDPGFGDLVSRVRDTDLAAYAHQDVPFEHLLEVLQPARSLSRQPLFDVMLSFYEVPDTDFSLGGLTVRPEILPSTNAKFKFDLTFQFGEQKSEGGLECAIEYSADLFTPAAARLLADRLSRLLTAVAGDPSLPLSRIDLLTKDERELVDTASAPARAGGHADLPQLLPTTRARKMAVRCGDVSLTYPRLRARVAGLATSLVARGAGPERVVTIDLRSPADQLTAVLAVLATGAAYHLADPANPAEPVDADLVLSTLDGVVPVAGSVKATGTDPRHAAAVSADGVVATRALLADVLAGLRERAPLRPVDRVLVPAADHALPAMLAALATGATVFIAEPAELSDTAALAQLVASAAPTVLFGTPAMVRALAVHADGLPAGLRVCTTGEPLSGALAARLLDGGTEVRDHYGHAESGLFALAGTPRHGDVVAPLDAVRAVAAHVLDDTLRPVPPGVRGELYLAGPALARGYHGRAALTATRFVANPFGAPGSRLFRTGDRARRGFDGSLELVTRAGEQVRVRGFAVRPVEVETVLTRHPAVAAAVVVAHEDRLVAYVLPAGTSVDEAALREHLARELPDFAVPSAVVALDTVPLTATGEVDEARLPVPAATSRHGSATAVEEVLRLVFAETLDVATVDLDADFFEMGGNSLLSVRLVALARKAGLSLSVADVLTHGTVERLATVVRDGGDAGDVLDPFAPVLAIRPTGDRAPLFCVHAGLGLSLPYLGLATHLDTGRPVYGLQSPNVGEDLAFPTSVEQVAAEYVARIREVQPSGPYNLLGWSFGGLLVHEIAVRLQRAGERVENLFVLDSFPIDGTEEAAPTQRELLVSFLEHLGFDGAEFSGAELSAADVLEVLRRGGSRLAGISEERMSRVLAVMSNNSGLAHEYAPPTFTGRMTLVLAAGDLDKAELAERARRWAPFVDGSVESHIVDCDHEYMMHPEPQAEIGRLVAANLDQNVEEEL